MLRIEIVGGDGAINSQITGEHEAVLVHRGIYAEGDVIRVAADVAGPHLVAQLDDAMLPAPLYLPTGTWSFPVPGVADRKAYSPKAFAGDMHRLAVRVARPAEIAALRNLALNPYDTSESIGVFPHAVASTATPQAAMAARCAIDGEIASAGHGYWPYTSWGINRDPEAELTVEFGREVEIDAVTLYLRADFPHDAWWNRVSLGFSDGTNSTIEPAKSSAAQKFAVGTRRTDSVRLYDLVKADDPSPFPALTQIEIWGRDV